MSVENLNVIDIVSIDLEGNAVLTISDHLEWDVNNEHLLILQKKINIYLGSIENGSLYESYPQAKGRDILINIIAKHTPSEDGKTFIKEAKETIESAKYKFSFSVHKY
jgi:hypothetical protein